MFAQTDVVDTTASIYSTNKFLPTGVRFGMDLVTLTRSRVKDGFDGWEVTADADFYRYLLVADYGKSSTAVQSENASYSNDGTYWRLGVDANFLTRDEDRNAFFLGVHYGRASYDEVMAASSADNAWGQNDISFTNTGMNANWLELNGGLKVKIWKWMWLGYTGRFKFALKYDKSQTMLPYDVPGYGRTDKQTTWGFNYYLFLRIPVRKTYSILPPRAK